VTDDIIRRLGKLKAENVRLRALLRYEHLTEDGSCPRLDRECPVCQELGLQGAWGAPGSTQGQIRPLSPADVERPFPER